MSILVRTDRRDINRFEVYPATREDVDCVVGAVALPFTAPRFPSKGLIYLGAISNLVDLPLAAAVDTLFLPHDIHKLLKKRRDADKELVQESAF